jgi:hypothetical protein
VFEVQEAYTLNLICSMNNLLILIIIECNLLKLMLKHNKELHY